MKVFVVGANGQIGRHLVHLLKESKEHSVRALIRKEEQKESFNQLGIETAVASLEDTVDVIAKAANGCDAIVFTAGSGGKTGPDKTLLIDLDGAVKTIEVAEELGINRFVMVSALQAHKRENWNEHIKPYYVAKHYADRVLIQSELNYTIIRPGGLLNESGTGKITAGESVQGTTIPREDVARIILESLEEVNTYKRSFDVVSGDTPIPDALKAL
ncbi:SDR family oxidoreductase [Mesobacillus maritimus]|uniref:SDR family oxidoreductase n=1 Tax=Mesobacillus maritimus TaxID=1643336 RepID=A0ABS7K197_9BACI|nr:SDR family oxidoreductase [Mesobacillus maritimus]MBY0096022.1 SDR family oxidoreductase [Mesobacillus maritimus]